MIKKTISFKNLDGNPIQRPFWFHLFKAEAIEIETSYKNGMLAVVEDIVQREDRHGMILFFKDLIAKAYGVRDDDGITFNKSPELSLKFTQTDAYSELFIELMSDARKAVEFVKGIMPEDLAARLPADFDGVNVDELLAGKEPVSLPDVDTFVSGPTAPGEVPSPEVVAAANEAPDERPLYERENRHATMEELRDMSPEEFQKAFAWKQAHPELKSGN